MYILILIKSVFLRNNKVPSVATEKRILFIHIPKAAGSSISLGLYGVQVGHKTALEYYISDKRNLENTKLFTVVRDPVERFLSAYYFLSQGGMHEYDKFLYDKYIGKFDNVNDFVMNGLSEDFIKNTEIIHFKTQSHFIYWRGRSLVNYIYKLTEINTLKSKIIDELGYELALEKRNVTNNNINKIELSVEAKNKIKNIYSIDYINFGFDL